MFTDFNRSNEESYDLSTRLSQATGCSFPILRQRVLPPLSFVATERPADVVTDDAEICNFHRVGIVTRRGIFIARCTGRVVKDVTERYGNL